MPLYTYTCENCDSSFTELRRVIDRDILRLQEELAQKLGTKVTLKSRSKGRGSLVIDYTSLAQLDTILARLMR